MAIMAKAPRVGDVKTRLVPPLSLVDAAMLSGCFIRDIANNVVTAAKGAPIEGYVAYGRRVLKTHSPRCCRTGFVSCRLAGSVSDTVCWTPQRTCSQPAMARHVWSTPIALLYQQRCWSRPPRCSPFLATVWFLGLPKTAAIT